MEKPKARRSSILSQAAQKEGYDLQGNMAEFVKQLPHSLVTTARHSAGLQISRSSSTLSTAAVPDPLPTPRDRFLAGYAGRGSSVSKPTSIPRPVGSVTVRRGPVMCFSRSGQRDDGRKPFSGKPIRSTSTDSLFAMTPGTPGSVPNLTLIGAEKSDMVAKTLKAPLATDRRAINTIALMVNGFLQDQQYPQRMSLDNISKMSLSQYLDACRFVLQRMMGPSFLANLKQDDLSLKLLEISNVFKYPGTLSKSILKSPNTAHSWPFALTFLAFLCCRVEAAITPIPSMIDHPINEIKDPESYAKDILVESYCRLFFQLLSQSNYSLETELDAYRERLRDMSSGPGSSTTVQELLLISDQKQRYLEEKEIEEDPRAELLDAMESQSKTICDVSKKRADLQLQLAKFKDLSAIQARRTTLFHTLDSVKVENMKDGDILNSQKVDLTKRKDLLKEIEEMRSQKAIVDRVNHGSKRKLQNREQFVITAQNRFYEVCARLNISNAFNEHLQKLELMKEVENMERMKNIPFTPDTLGAWLKATRRVHRHTKQIISKLQDQMQDAIFNGRNKIAYYVKKESELENNHREYNSQKELLQENEGRQSSHINDELTKLNLRAATLKDETNKILTLCSKDEAIILEVTEKLKGLNSENQKLAATLDDIGVEKEELTAEIVEFEGTFLQSVQKLMCEHVEKRRQMMSRCFEADPDVMKKDSRTSE